MAPPNPSDSRASVRAMMTKLASRRAAELLHHVGGGDERFVVEMAAALRAELVFEVAAAQAELLEFLDGARHAHGLAKTRVGVNDGGQAGDTGDGASALGDLTEGGETDIGQGEVSRQDGAGDIHALEAVALDQQRDQGRKGAREPEQFARAQCGAETGAFLGGGFGREEHIRKCRGYRGSRK
jgi:hypothetical protein